MRDDRISVIVRSSDPARLPFLDEALFSLCTQGWDAIEVIVALQNPAPDFVAAAERLAARQPWPEAALWAVLPVAVPAGTDGRSRLLDAGIARATGRYLAFLDDDDVIYPRAYATLIAELRAQPHAALAAGAARLAFCSLVDGTVRIERKEAGAFDWGRSKLDLLRDNFIPIHSYVLDRDRIAPGTLAFRDPAIPLEDYDFLLRLAAGHGFALARRDTLVCEYRIHQTNTVWKDGKPVDAAVPPRLQAARDFVFAEAARIRLTVTKAELPDIEQALSAVCPPQLRPRFLHRQADRAYAWIEARPWLTRRLVGAYLRMRSRRPGA